MAMVILTLADIAVETSWWALKKSYNLGYYMMYGETESKEDKILKQIEELRKQNELERLELNEIRNENRMMREMYIRMIESGEIPSNRQLLLEDSKTETEIKVKPLIKQKRQSLFDKNCDTDDDIVAEIVEETTKYCVDIANKFNMDEEEIIEDLDQENIDQDDTAQEETPQEEDFFLEIDEYTANKFDMKSSLMIECRNDNQVLSSDMTDDSKKTEQDEFIYNYYRNILNK